MKTLMKIILMMVLAMSPALAAYAQEALWKELNAKFLTLYQQGRYTEAAKVAEEALKVAENKFAPDDLNVAASLNSLASVYRDQGKYPEAEPLIKRSLVILEEALGAQTIPMWRKYWKTWQSCTRRLEGKTEQKK